jgi:hypothetical protein
VAAQRPCPGRLRLLNPPGTLHRIALEPLLDRAGENCDLDLHAACASGLAADRPVGAVRRQGQAIHDGGTEIHCFLQTGWTTLWWRLEAPSGLMAGSRATRAGSQWLGSHHWASRHSNTADHVAGRPRGTERRRPALSSAQPEGPHFEEISCPHRRGALATRLERANCQHCSSGGAPTAAQTVRSSSARYLFTKTFRRSMPHRATSASRS